MTAGDCINYANCVSAGGTAWRHSYSGSSRITYTYVIAAPAFHLEAWFKGSGWWGYQEGSMNVSYWNGSGWTNVMSKSCELRGSGSSSHWWYRHNYSGGGGSEGQANIPDVHFWKVSVYIGDNNGSGSFVLYTGGIERIPEAVYNAHFAGKHLKCSKGGAWRFGSGQTYADDAAFFAAQGYPVYSGTPISISAGTHIYLCA